MYKLLSKLFDRYLKNLNFEHVINQTKKLKKSARKKYLNDTLKTGSID